MRVASSSGKVRKRQSKVKSDEAKEEQREWNEDDELQRTSWVIFADARHERRAAVEHGEEDERKIDDIEKDGDCRNSNPTMKEDNANNRQGAEKIKKNCRSATKRIHA